MPHKRIIVQPNVSPISATDFSSFKKKKNQWFSNNGLGVIGRTPTPPNGTQENLIWIRIVGDVVGTLRTCINMITVVIVRSRSIVSNFIFFFSPVQM